MKKLLLLLIVLSITFLLHSHLRSLYQKEIVAHARLSTAYSQFMQKELRLNKSLQQKPTSTAKKQNSSLEQLEFNRYWRKISLREIPLITIAPSSAQEESLSPLPK